MFEPQSHTEQVAAHLRSQLLQGLWTHEMPGVMKLQRDLGVSHTVVDRALRLLEAEGLLKNRGPGRRRRILLSRSEPVSFRIQVLLYEKQDLGDPHTLEMMRLLQEAGHQAVFAGKSLVDLGMSVKRVARFVGAADADAWVVMSGGPDVLEWFARQPTPAFAMFGRTSDVPLASAGPGKMLAVTDLIERLARWGHRRIVYLVREDRRKPRHGLLEQHFLDQLTAQGLSTGRYNLPNWGDTAEELERFLDDLLRQAPPTALLMDGPSLFVAVRDHLARKGICAPEQVSLACADAHAMFDWCRPQVTHIAWDSLAVNRHVVRWAHQIGRGKDFRRKKLFDARLVVGGTIGPLANAG